MKSPRTVLAALGAWLVASTFAEAQIANATKPAAPGDQPTGQRALTLDEIVVTGVFTATSVQDATASISTINSRMLSEQVPVSAADLLLTVPGVGLDNVFNKLPPFEANAEYTPFYYSPYGNVLFRTYLLKVKRDF